MTSEHMKRFDVGWLTLHMLEFTSLMMERELKTTFQELCLMKNSMQSKDWLNEMWELQKIQMTFLFLFLMVCCIAQIVVQDMQEKFKKDKKQKIFMKI